MTNCTNLKFDEPLVIQNYGENQLFSNFIKSNQITNKNKINAEPSLNFSAGMKIVCNGFLNQVKNVAKNIIMHPIKTVGTMVVSSAALMLLPLVGISMATGAAALAVAFGTIALYKTMRNVWDARKYSKQGNTEALKNSLNKVGENGVDLLLTLPFMPKAIRHLKCHVPSYFTKTLAFHKNKNGVINYTIDKYWGGTQHRTFDANGKLIKVLKKESLLTKILNAKTWRKKFEILTSQDRTELMYNEINKAYKQIAKKRGFSLPRDIQTCAQPAKITFDTNNKPTIELTGGFIEHDGLRTDVIHLNKLRINNQKTSEMLRRVGHEHRHVEQQSMIARAEDLAPDFSEKSLGLHFHKNGTIKKGTPEYLQAEKFYNAHKNYAQDCKAGNYATNLLEVDARQIGETEIAAQISEQLAKNTNISNVADLELSCLPYSSVKDNLVVNGNILIKQGKTPQVK